MPKKSWVRAPEPSSPLLFQILDPPLNACLHEDNERLLPDIKSIRTNCAWSPIVFGDDLSKFSIQFSIQFAYLRLKHTYMQIIIKMQRRPAKGL